MGQTAKIKSVLWRSAHRSGWAIVDSDSNEVGFFETTSWSVLIVYRHNSLNFIVPKTDNAKIIRWFWIKSLKIINIWNSENLSYEFILKKLKVGNGGTICNLDSRNQYSFQDSTNVIFRFRINFKRLLQEGFELFQSLISKVSLMFANVKQIHWKQDTQESIYNIVKFLKVNIELYIFWLKSKRTFLKIVAINENNCCMEINQTKIWNDTFVCYHFVFENVF